MNLIMLRPKNETEDIIFSKTMNCKAVIKRTHTRPKETLDLEPTQPKEFFSKTTPISIEGSWMIGLTSLEVYIPFHKK